MATTSLPRPLRPVGTTFGQEIAPGVWATCVVQGHAPIATIARRLRGVGQVVGDVAEEWRVLALAPLPTAPGVPALAQVPGGPVIETKAGPPPARRGRLP